MRIGRSLAASIMMPVVLLAPAARADDGDLVGLLNEKVITTASQSAETASSAPAVSTTITAEDLRAFGIHSLDEAIDFLSLGAVTSDNLRDGDIGARGVLVSGDHGNHFLILVDGHAMNEALRGSAQFGRGAGIPLEIVDHVEIILGPGSVLYGSNAMLGVINIVTRRAKDFKGTHAIAETELGKSYRVSAAGGYPLRLFDIPAELTLQLEYYRMRQSLDVPMEYAGS